MEESKRSLQDINNNGDQMKILLNKLARAKNNKNKMNQNLISCVSRSFPIELVMEILNRLPIEVIFQCKVVCKDWRDEINNPGFIKFHILHTVNMNKNKISSSVVLFSRLKQKLIYVDFQSSKKIKIMPLPYYFKCRFLIGSCNGLLCFEEAVSGHYSLCNPITGAYNPMPPLVSEIYPWYSLSLGFGYDYSSDDYKVLFLSSRFLTAPFLIRLYSLKRDSWKEITDTCGYDVTDVITSCLVFSNNALHWITHSKTIRGFDLGSETFHDISLPGDLKAYYNLDIMDLRGCLHLVTYKEIWIMKKYRVQQSWTKVFDFGRACTGFKIMPYAYSQDGGELLVALDNFVGEFLCLDLHRQQFKKLEISGLSRNLVNLKANLLILVKFNSTLRIFMIEDLFEELSKYGEIESINICDNLADHMVGNVYVQFREEEHAAEALRNLSGRFDPAFDF